MYIYYAVALAAFALFSISAEILKNQEASTGNLDAEFYSREFAYFQTRYGKTYENADEIAHRRAIFVENMNKINQHNAKANGKSWTMASNQFTDLTTEEFVARLGRSKGDKPENATNFVMTEIKPRNEIPDQVDWTREGAVSSVKNQFDCGSGWSFAAAGAIEGAWALKTGGLLSLSEQQLLDCTGPYGEQGCSGGTKEKAFKYATDNDLCLEDDYPYISLEETCKPCKGRVRINSYVRVPSENQMAFLTALSKQPVGVAVDGRQMQFYSGGIFDMCWTSFLDINHEMLAVGYNLEDGYYKLKNSFGTGWGEDGYIRVCFGGNGRGGDCGVLTDPSFPLIK